MPHEELAEDDRAVRRVDEILHVLIDPMVAGLQGRRRRRLEAAEDALRRCFEITAGLVLTEPERALLALEVQLEPVGAAARVASAPALLRVLPIFLEDADWEGEDDEDRRVRMRLALELVGCSVRVPELAVPGAEAARAAVTAAWRAARWRLRHDQDARRLAGMDPVQRAWLQAELAAIAPLAKRRPSA